MFPILRFAQFGFLGLVASAALSLAAQERLSQTNAQALWQSAQASFIEGKPNDCYRQLSSISDVLLGEIAYDRLLGLCASASGEHEQALLAFERIIIQQPKNAEIRLERARTLYLLGQFQESQDEFRALAENNPPASARPVIQEFLKRVNSALTPKLKVNTSLQINLKTGHDSNANSASDLEDFLGFSVSENSRSTDSAMYGLDVRLRHSRPIAQAISERLLLTSSLNLSDKRYPDADFVDQNLGIATLGLVHIGSRHTNRVDTVAYGQRVDGRFNSRGYFLRYAHNYRWKPNLEIGSYYKAGAIRYYNDLRIKDVNQYTLGTTARYSLSSKKQQSIGFDLNVGRDYPIFRNSNYRRDIYNLRLDHSYEWSNTVNTKFSTAYSAFDYKRPFFAQAFPGPRDDEQVSALAELKWSMTDKWTLTPRVGYGNLSSNVDIFEFDRVYYELNLAHVWNW